MFGFWKNNGPRPPWGPEEILAILGAMLRLYVWYMITVLALNLIAMGILEVLRRHHIGF